MYTESDLDALRRQISRRWITLLLPAAVFFALSLFFAIQRNEPLTVAFSLLCGALLIAGWGLAVKPVSAYARHVDAMLHGISHTIEADYLSLDADESMVDGNRFRAIRVTCVDDEDKPYERLFYWDAEKPLPAFEAGQRLSIRYHDKAVISAEPV